MHVRVSFFTGVPVNLMYMPPRLGTKRVRAEEDHPQEWIDLFLCEICLVAGRLNGVNVQWRRRFCHFFAVLPVLPFLSSILPHFDCCQAAARRIAVKVGGIHLEDLAEPSTASCLRR